GHRMFVGQHIVDSPTHIALPGTCAPAPPGIVLRLFRKVAKRVDVTLIEPARKFCALFGQEATGFLILLRACQIDLLVCNIEITNHKRGLLGALQGLQTLKECAIKLQLIRHATVVALFATAVWKITIDQRELAETRNL